MSSSPRVVAVRRWSAWCFGSGVATRFHRIFHRGLATKTSRFMAAKPTTTSHSTSKNESSPAVEDDDENIHDEDLKWEPPEEIPRFNMSFAGCGFLGIYHLGVTSVLVKHGQGFLQCVEKFGGASAGALVATLLATKGSDQAAVESCVEFLYESADTVYKKKLGLLTPGLSVLDSLEAFTDNLLPRDAHILATDRLYISLTKGRKNVLVSEYDSRDDLLKCMLGSSYVPHITGNKPVIWKGRVHPRNLIRGLHAFFPPKKDHLKIYYSKGVRDAETFLKREKFYGKLPVEKDNNTESSPGGSRHNMTMDSMASGLSYVIYETYI